MGGPIETFMLLTVALVLGGQVLEHLTGQPVARLVRRIDARLAESKRRRDEQRRLDREAYARSIGLEPGSGEQLRGEVGGFQVATWTELGTTGDTPLGIRVVRLASAGAWPSAFRFGTRPHVVTPATMSLMEPGGRDEAADLAVLDPAASAALEAWRDAEHRASPPAGVFVAGGELLLVVPERPPDLRARMERMAVVARALDRGGRSISRCLADGLATADAEGRLARLRLLATRFAREAGIGEACARRLDDTDPHCRLWAARGAGAPGIPSLRALAMDGAMPEAVRLEALADWLKAAPMTTGSAEGVEPLLLEPSAELRAAGLDAIRRLAGKPSANVLSHLAEQATGAEAIALARLAGEGRRSDAEPALLQMLRRRGRGVTDEVLRALQDCGTPACIREVLPLTKGALVAPETKLLARAALQAVRGRMGDVGAGRLDLAEGAESGGLALPEKEGGGELSGLPGDAGSLAPEDSIS